MKKPKLFCQGYIDHGRPQSPVRFYAIYTADCREVARFRILKHAFAYLAEHEYKGVRLRAPGGA